VADPDGTPVPKQADKQLLMSYELAGRVQEQDLTAVIKYMTKKGGFSQDFSITFVSSLMRRDYNLMRAPGMQAWISKNAQLVNLISGLAQ
jgi:hypothetical protein